MRLYLHTSHSLDQDHIPALYIPLPDLVTMLQYPYIWMMRIQFLVRWFRLVFVSQHKLTVSKGGRAYMESCKLRFDTCKETRLAQPHKKQPSIKSFFSNSTSTKMKKRKSTGTFDTQEKRKIPKQRTGLLKYFA
mmetsp:Transcript_15180/g.17191  ORF Transcript_15180/g.17191 Transcript_15180/m.17191 type:complete len:134 (-) Transcript_15180:458-859(-)